MQGSKRNAKKDWSHGRTGGALLELNINIH